MFYFLVYPVKPAAKFPKKLCNRMKQQNIRDMPNIE